MNTEITSTRERPDVSIVIPVYQSQDTLPNLLEQIHSVTEASSYSFEVILVEDGSPDQSWDRLEELAGKYADTVTAVQLMRNFGQHNAIMCGLRHAAGRYILTMDDDLQNPPAEIPRLIEAIVETDDDVVYGVPDQKKHAVGRNLGSWCVNVFFRSVFRTDITVTPFRIMSRRIVESILPYQLNFTYLDGLLAWNTQRMTQITVDHHPRAQGRSGYSLMKLVTLALNLFTNFSVLPLQITSAAGLLSACFGLACGTYYLIMALSSGFTVPGYASTIVAIMVLGGVQLLALGMMGEYVGRLHLNMNRKPQYTIRKVVSGRTEDGMPPRHPPGSSDTLRTDT